MAIFSPMDAVTPIARQAFYARRRSALVPLCVHDTVVVTHGEYRGREAAVISIESAGRDPSFLVELLDTGSDKVIPASQLCLVGER